MKITKRFWLVTADDIDIENADYESTLDRAIGEAKRLVEDDDEPVFYICEVRAVVKKNGVTVERL